MNPRFMRGAALTVACVALASCTTVHTTRPVNPGGRPTVYLSPDSPGEVQGVGIESQDIISVTDQMVRDLMATPGIANPANPPRIRIDASLIKNESSQRINRNLFSERVRSGAMRAALRMRAGLEFVSRAHVDEQVKEHELRQRGIVDQGTLGRQQLMSVDYRLQGKIMDRVSKSASTGIHSRYYLIVFELKEEGTGRLVWISEPYEFEKAGADDVIYR